MIKKVLTLGPKGNLVLKSADGRMEDIHRSVSGCVYVIIDCSGSMSGEKLDRARLGAFDFATEAVRKDYRVGLIGFDTTASVICEPLSSMSQFEDALGSLAAGGSTNMTQAIELATDRLLFESGIRSMVIVTDGVPDDPDAALLAGQKAKVESIDIIAIGTDPADREFLAKLATRNDLATHVPSDQLRQGIAGAAKLLLGGKE